MKLIKEERKRKDKFSISVTTPLVNKQIPHRRLASRTVLICDGTVPKISGFGIDFFQPSGQVGTDFLHLEGFRFSLLIALLLPV